MAQGLLHFAEIAASLTISSGYCSIACRQLLRLFCPSIKVILPLTARSSIQKIEMRYSLRPVILIVFWENWRSPHSRKRRLSCLIHRCLPTVALVFIGVRPGMTTMISPAFSLIPLYHCVTSTNSEKLCKTNRNFITG